MSTRRQVKILDEYEKSKLITPDARRWLIGCLDPFHDTEIALAGTPTMSSSRSVVQMVQRTITVSRPTDFTAPTWDCHIFNSPLVMGSPNDLDQPHACLSYNTSGALAPDATVEAAGNGIAVFATPPGANWYGPSAKALWNGVQLPSRFVKGRHRLVGCGFEVVNSTAPLYAQGSVTTYKMSSPPIHAQYNAGASPNATYGPITLIRGGAGTIAEAALLPNSRTWAATEGVYAVCTTNEAENTPVFPYPSTALVTNASEFYPSQSQSRIYGSGSVNNQICVYPFDITGAIFTGLSVQTSLTITVRYIVEHFPDPRDDALVVLSRPTTSYDAVALELYARCMEHLPPAVRVGDNPLGEWFASILRAIGNYAPVIGAAIPHPAAKVIGTALGTAAKAGEYWVESARAKGRRKQAQTSEVKQEERRQLIEANSPPVRSSPQNRGYPAHRPIAPPSRTSSSRGQASNLSKRKRRGSA